MCSTFTLTSVKVGHSPVKRNRGEDGGHEQLANAHSCDGMNGDSYLCAAAGKTGENNGSVWSLPNAGLVHMPGGGCLVALLAAGQCSVSCWASVAMPIASHCRRPQLNSNQIQVLGWDCSNMILIIYMMGPDWARGPPFLCEPG
ncbi:unnamed protein product [Ostreobium quekettii]|uniref:Uncharacterized protein n=1 Tax=Ostreobium quekettii TaxID=121088 RepID=A0A8S1IVX1_9CHLO|nr:unnamed protein product [Ostreobium quekettii]